MPSVCTDSTVLGIFQYIHLPSWIDQFASEEVQIYHHSDCFLLGTLCWTTCMDSCKFDCILLVLIYFPGGTEIVSDINKHFVCSLRTQVIHRL